MFVLAMSKSSLDHSWRRTREAAIRTNKKRLRIDSGVQFSENPTVYLSSPVRLLNLSWIILTKKDLFVKRAAATEVMSG